MGDDAIRQLAQILTFSRKEKGWTRRNVAQVAGCPERLVEEWENGEAVPDGQRWNKLCRALDRSLYQWNVLHRNALTELRAKHDEKPATTSFGDKLRQAVAQAAQPLMVVAPQPQAPEVVQAVVPEPEPAPEDPEQLPDEPNDALDPEERLRRKRLSDALRALPSGWKTQEAVAEREQAARELLTQRPRMPLAGPGGLHETLRERFGVSVHRARLAEIRDEVQREVLKQVIPDVQGTWPKPVVDPLAAACVGTTPTYAYEPPAGPSVHLLDGADPAEQLTAGIELLREAIPGLAELLLTVDNNGEVDVQYKVREIKVVEKSGSLKLGGKRP